MELKYFKTETRNPKSMNLDRMSSLEIVRLMNEEDSSIAGSLKDCLEDISKAIDIVYDAFRNDGRLIYMGAGTSGRLGVLDASECPPTFGVGYDRVIGLIAGGDKAIRYAAEGAEDKKELGKEDLVNINLNSNDVVVGIAASGRTPYVIGGLEYSKSLGCKTISVSCNKNSEIGKYSDVNIEAEVGSEVLTGSTRLKAGTATKMIINMISTGAMVRSGKAYENLMVDMHISNEKLQDRGERIVCEATGVNREEAKKKLVETSGDIKLAIMMILSNLDKLEAKKLLNDNEGHIYKAISKK